MHQRSSVRPCSKRLKLRAVVIFIVCVVYFIYAFYINSCPFRRQRIVPLASYPKEGIGTGAEIYRNINVSVFDSFCERHTDILAIIPVYSATNNFKRRQAIRETIGRECVHFKCAVFFIIGVTFNRTVFNAIETEYDVHKDILMVNKIDTYRDLNNKVIAMLDWLTESCTQPKYVLHIIDDTYPNIGYFIDHLNSISENKFILGHFYVGSEPLRNVSHKWHAHKFEYPYKFFPKYGVGVVYAFLNKDCSLLRSAAYNAEHFWIEDVWFTGLVRKQAGFSAIQVIKTFNIGDPPATLTDIWKTHFCVHNVNESVFYDIYNATHN